MLINQIVIISALPIKGVSALVTFQTFKVSMFDQPTYQTLLNYYVQCSKIINYYYYAYCLKQKILRGHFM